MRDAFPHLPGEDLYVDTISSIGRGMKDSTLDQSLGHQENRQFATRRCLDLAPLIWIIQVPRLPSHQPESIADFSNGPHLARLAFRNETAYTVGPVVGGGFGQG